MTDAPLPSFLEDPRLALAVSEAEEFVGSAGWDQPTQIFALVLTTDLVRAQPEMAGQLDGGAYFTPVAQEAMPRDDLADALDELVWPAAVAGCVLVQEIVVLPPAAATALPTDPTAATAAAAAHPERTEARLAVGVLRDGSAACLLRLRGDHDDAPLRGADLAPNLVEALHRTLDGHPS